VRRLCLVLVAALGWPGSAGANLLGNGGFERGVGGWVATPARSATLSRSARAPRAGEAALRVAVRRRGAAGAVSPLVAQRLRDGELYSPVTGTLDGTFRGSVWVRGAGQTLGRKVRIQLNEFGGVRAEEPIATATARLARTWTHVRLRGTVRRSDRTGVAALAFLDHGKPGDRFFLDEFLVSGQPPERAPPGTGAERWSWWSYALVWALVIGVGAGWVVYSRRRGKNRSRRVTVLPSIRPPAR
jgi:hypothetical protein